MEEFEGELYLSHGRIEELIVQVPFFIREVDLETKEYGCHHCGGSDTTTIAYSTDGHRLIIAAEVKCDSASVIYRLKGNK